MPDILITMVALEYLIILFLGLTFGSFLTALTYRLPKGISILKGRSLCPNCKKKISWHDNIPIFSYFFLDGKCRNCKKIISLRYPLIEFGTMLTFLFITYFFNSCTTTIQGASLRVGAICQWKGMLGFWALPYLLLISTGFIAVFVIDLEQKIILDSIVLPLFALTLFLFVFFNPDYAYSNFLLAFAAALFLLVIHLITKGKGMGLGDVKLALFGGVVLGWPGSISWLLLSFVIGATVGVILVLLKKAEFGKHIPFGPFLVLSFFIALVYGEKIFISIFR